MRTEPWRQHEEHVDVSVHEVTAEVADLRTAIGDLESLVAVLSQRHESDRSIGPVDAADMAEAIEASRIITAANRIADATVAESRAEADELLVAARAKSFEVVGVARELAEAELVAERDRVAAATESWNAHRSEIRRHLASLAVSLDQFRTELAATGAAIEAALEGLADGGPGGGVGHADVVSAGPEPVGSVGISLVGSLADLDGPPEDAVPVIVTLPDRRATG
ncbi:MAG: hypothetical protein K1X38_10640 [Microthrixaceae bacterium]|nr:hypothetical protein [Microthrixaceae bacterium]